MKNTVKQKRNGKTTYRSFKNLDETALLRDIENAPLHIADIFDDIDDVCWAHEKLLSEVIDEHIPVKERKQRPSKAPYMNGRLRKETNYKKKLRRTFENSRTTNNWNNFRIQRNKVTSLKRAAIRGYFFERCSGGPQSKDFWPTIKPFLSKGSANSLNICLLEDGNVVNDPVSVCNIFNDHFSTIILQTTLAETLYSEEEVKNHTSVIKIREHVLTSVPSVSVPFVFKPISERQVDKYITSIGKKESYGPGRSFRKSSQNYQKTLLVSSYTDDKHNVRSQYISKIYEKCEGHTNL